MSHYFADGAASLRRCASASASRTRRRPSRCREVASRSRTTDQGDGWQATGDSSAVGVHRRGTGPGDTFSLPYFEVGDIDAALERVKALGGTVVHPGSQWAICKDSEGTPFGLARRSQADASDPR